MFFAINMISATRMFKLLTISFYSDLIHWMENYLISCPSKKFLHIDCPGCGLQRSIIALLKGDFLSSLQLYPATIPILTTFIFLGFHLKNKYAKGAFILTYMYLFCAAIVIINYIYKIATHQIH